MYAIRSYYEPHRGGGSHARGRRGGDGRIGAEPSAMKALGSPLVQAMDGALVEALAYYGVRAVATIYATRAESEGGLGVVITSYSIHYTKLYDRRVPA